MILYPDCDYFNEERDSPSAPVSHTCDTCYRLDLCQSSIIMQLTNSERKELINGMEGN